MTTMKSPTGIIRERDTQMLTTLTTQVRDRISSFDEKQREEERGTLLRRIARLEAELIEARASLGLVDEIGVVKAANKDLRIEDVARRFRNVPFFKSLKAHSKLYLLQKIAADNHVDFTDVAHLCPAAEDLH
jgi:hypothetical protein